jgi:parallel beta-helix repeat protein
MGENTLPMECTDPAYISTPVRRVVRDYAPDNTIRSNTFHDVTYGIRVEDDGTRVIGNRFYASSPDHHAVIVGTPDRTAVLGEPVRGTLLKGNEAAIEGNDSPFRWIHGHQDTEERANVAFGHPAPLCEGQPVPRQPFVFVIAFALAGPGGTAPASTPDLTVPTLGALPSCAAP